MTHVNVLSILQLGTKLLGLGIKELFEFKVLNSCNLIQTGQISSKT
jgi:hypothetical protein